MTPTPGQKRNRQNAIVTRLLLVLLAVNLVHNYSCPAAIRVSLDSTADQSPVFSSSEDAREQPYSKAQPCLACTCQKHTLAILSSLCLLLGPLQVDHPVIELEQVVNSQPYLNLNLSRAPPVLGH